MIKCVQDSCNQTAKYIYFGKSLCEKHFKELVKEVEKADKVIKKGT